MPSHMRSMCSPSFTTCCVTRRNPPTASFLRNTGPTTGMCLDIRMIRARPARFWMTPDTRERDGVRFHIVMKSSTDESTRLMAAVLQQQLREVGIALDIRTYEFATFFSDITKGAYQMYSMRWIGGNQDPDIFEYVFDSGSFPPKRANRTFYANPRVDELIREGRSTLDQQKRKIIYAEIQRIVAEDLPYINLWYLDNVLSAHQPSARHRIESRR